MPEPLWDAVVVGAGPAGLGTSYLLKRDGVRHLVLERGSIGESWRTQRWDSFVLNSPNKFNVLAGESYEGSRPDGFDSASDFISYLRGYAKRHDLPVHEHVRVTSITRALDTFLVTASDDGRTNIYSCRRIVVASGGMNAPKIPSFAAALSPDVKQLHVSAYRNSSQLPDGAVLVVGSAQSGIQVTEDLIEAGRRVYLATSAVSRVPRRYRGKDIFEWLVMIGFYDVKTEDVTDPREFEMRPPQISGVGPLGHTQSLQSLARMGAVILGRLAGTRGNTLDIEPSAANNVKFSDEVSRKVKGMIEGYIVKHQLPVPPGEPDPADEPDTDALCASTITSLDLKANDIRSVVWTTGFSSDLNYLKVPVLDGSGRPRHRSGIADIDGLYFIGLPWLRKRKSGLIYGMREDAEFIAGTINRVRST